MNGQSWCRVCLMPFALAALAWFSHPAAPTALAYTPDSPEVKKCVDQAVKFLETADEHRPGGKALVGLALLKYGKTKGHPQVKEAVETIRRQLGQMKPEDVRMDIYSTGLSTIFLLELDPIAYASEIQCLLDSLVVRQKPHGGWGYPERETGDTSMTQYGVLCAWEGTHKGFRFPNENVDGVATWLLRTQDPGGGFGYQGKLALDFRLVKQTPVRLSLSAAGLGSLLMCADLLGVGVDIRAGQSDLPPALREVEEEDPAAKKNAKTQLDPRLFHAAQSRGRTWLSRNYEIAPKEWTHYYLYALERYMSFQELAEREATGRAPDKEPRWYNDGVVYLGKSQNEDGSWEGRCGAPVDTAFGVLFLLRSQKKSIEKARSFGAGSLVGGRGIPKETDRAEVRGGKVVARPLLGPAEELLAKLDDRDAPGFEEALALLAEMPAEQISTLAGEQAAKLHELAADRTPEARLAAVEALAKGRSLEYVPTLIYALTDPDLHITRVARDALRRIARKPQGFGLPDKPSEADRRRAVKSWKNWYLAVRPDAEFDF